MIICRICERIFGNINGLAKHIQYSHKEISKEEYYKKYISEVSPVCKCGKNKKFRGLGEGYRTSCSIICRDLDEYMIEGRIRVATKRKQSQETIKKRIENTDQHKKQIANKNTVLKKYGVDNVSKIPEIRQRNSNASKGRKRPRTEQHQKNIIESKRNNNTLKHSNSTKKRITDALLAYSQNGEDQTPTFSKFPTNGRGHKTGFHHGILFRSSYELIFILFCEKYRIKIESAENSIRRVRYIHNERKHWYYPDFYLPDLDICVEVKPLTMMNDLFLVKKSFAEKIYANYVVLSEAELFNEHILYEHIFIRPKPIYISSDAV